MKNTNKTPAMVITILLFGLLAILGILSIACFFSATAQDDTGYFVAFIFFGVAFIIELITILIIYVGGYNRLVSIKNKVAESLSLVDVQLKMRFDLVPNLVEVVKGHAKHEKQIFENIAKIRAEGLAAKDEQKIEKANQLIGEINNILAVVEDYPELKSNKLFLKLMEDLRDIENKIAASRRFYNSNITAFNNAVQKFPSNMVATLFGFSTMQMFQIEVNERILPNVSF
jgi:LemA protein